MQADQSNKAAFHHEEGLRLAALGQLREAANHFNEATRLRSDRPVWFFNLGLTLQRLDQLRPSIAAYENAIKLAPEFFDAWNNLAAAYKADGDFPAAVVAGRRTVELGPESPAAHLNLGNALKASGDIEAACEAYRKACVLDPANDKAQLNLANTLRDKGELAEAICLLREVTARSPAFAEAHRDLAFALLLGGRLPEGWRENEWRWKTEEMAPKRRVYSKPRWRGENPSGKTIFVYTEQGFGDAIQFVRYAPLVARADGKVILECQRPLRRLFETVAGVSRLIVRNESPPPFDFEIPLLSLPNVFQTTLDTIPNEGAYLRSPRKHPSLPEPAKFNVGIVWAGNPDHINDQRRSISRSVVEKLFDLPEARFYSLQVGKSDQGPRPADSNRLIDLGSRIQDFADTAAFVDQLDLVISVDTATAHLAGAMGKPAWLLLPFAPDWRWLLNRDDTPWYPTMRLFRQRCRGDWAEVIERVKSELTRTIVA